MIELGPNRYGKSQIRVVRVLRDTTPHRVHDLTVAIALEGAFERAHTEGDNADVIATDTMKNTAYAFAVDHLDGSIEAYGRALAEHFCGQSQVTAAEVTIRERPWRPIDGAADALQRDGSLVRTALVRAGAAGVVVEAGVDELIVMKTTRSAFSGFPRDRYTTLKETEDRILATSIAATWRYADADVDHDRLWQAALDALLASFADHHSVSVQASIWIVGRAMLEAVPEITEIRFRLPNLHHWLADLAPFGMENQDAVYVATTEPHGLIEATVRRGT